jgi:hypothetical protein
VIADLAGHDLRHHSEGEPAARHGTRRSFDLLHAAVLVRTGILGRDVHLHRDLRGPVIDALHAILADLDHPLAAAAALPLRFWHIQQDFFPRQMLGQFAPAMPLPATLVRDLFFGRCGQLGTGRIALGRRLKQTSLRRVFEESLAPAAVQITPEQFQFGLEFLNLRLLLFAGHGRLGQYAFGVCQAVTRGDQLLLQRSHIRRQRGVRAHAS